MKRSSPASARNREPLAATLAVVLPPRGLVLEVASGAGEHAAFLAARFPALEWQPSDCDPAALKSIRAYRDDAGLPNLRPPFALDAAEADWPVDAADAILCVNMVHISPWTATLGLLAGAARLLPTAGPLILYGPYRQAGVPTAPSNEVFHQSLQARDPAWGLRRLEDVIAAADREGLALGETVRMPANNLTLVFRRR